MSSSLSLCISGWSHIGKVREKNDDHYLCGPFVEQDANLHLELPLSSRSVDEHGFLCAVADGMGGYSGGALASRVLLETLAAFFYSQTRPNASMAITQAAMEVGFEHARSALNSHLRREPQLTQAGTTVAGLLFLENGQALPFHLGDSRVFRWTAGFLRALTLDHTPLAREVAEGHLEEEVAARSPRASQLTGCFGLDDHSPIAWGEPLTLAEGDLFLIATDGWNGMGRGLSHKTINEILNHFEGDDQALVKHLVQSAVQADGTDNATLLLIRVTQDRGHNLG